MEFGQKKFHEFFWPGFFYILWPTHCAMSSKLETTKTANTSLHFEEYFFVQDQNNNENTNLSFQNKKHLCSISKFLYQMWPLFSNL